MQKAEKISALVIAGGFSTRMGEFKPLLPLGHGKVIEKTVLTFLAAGIDDVRVVVGHRGDEIVPLITPLGAVPVFNQHYAGGMYTSVLSGVSSLPPDTEGFFLMPADIPTVRPRTVTEILQAYREHSAEIVYPIFKGMRGHPPLISGGLIPAIKSWNGSGLRAFLAEKEEGALDLPVIDQGVLMDMDNPDDYNKIKNYYNRRDIPTEEECYAILSRFNADNRLLGHSQTVAAVACQMAFLLNNAGCRLNISLIRAAALLHDLAKGVPDHAKAGAVIVKSLGFPKVARIVAAHTDIIPQPGGMVSERELVYLADKVVRGDQVVSFEARFQYPLEKYSGIPEILQKIKGRLDSARLIQKKIDCILGKNKEDGQWMPDLKQL